MYIPTTQECKKRLIQWFPADRETTKNLRAKALKKRYYEIIKRYNQNKYQIINERMTKQ